MLAAVDIALGAAASTVELVGAVAGTAAEVAAGIVEPDLGVAAHTRAWVAVAGTAATEVGSREQTVEGTEVAAAGRSASRATYFVEAAYYLLLLLLL